MAYRQLCALSFAVLGSLSVACGGSTNTSVDTSSSSTSSDQPPASSDQPPAPQDQPPSSADTPPASADAAAGSGGDLAQLCQKFCSSVVNVLDHCGGGMQSFDQMACTGNDTCQVPANVPCKKEFIDAFNCVIDEVDMLCPADTGSMGNDTQPANVCSDAAKALSSCAEKSGLDLNTMTMTETPKGCFPSGGCDCPEKCQKCTCKAGSDSTAIAACFQPGEACSQ